MSLRSLALLGATATLAAAGAPAVAGATATDTGRHKVIVDSTYVYERAGSGFSGTLFKGQTFKVKRLSPSGKHAYGMAYGRVNRHVWIKASALGR